MIMLPTDSRAPLYPASVLAGIERADSVPIVVIAASESIIRETISFLKAFVIFGAFVLEVTFVARCVVKARAPIRLIAFLGALLSATYS